MNLLWIILIVATVVRSVVAAMGHFSGTEAYLMLCAHHLDWGFVDGPAGVPALMRVCGDLSGWTLFGIRLLSPVMLLLASWMLARLARTLRGEEVAFWSVIAFNLTPLAMTASLVMDGTMVVVAAWMVSLEAAWNLLSSKKSSFASWIFFGVILALATQVTYAIGWLLLVVLLWEFLIQGKWSHLLGAGAALFFLALGWVGPVWWNMHHDWLQVSDITWGSFWSWQAPPLHLFYEVPLCWITPLLLPVLMLGLYALLPLHQKNKKKELSFLLLVLVPLFFYLGKIGHHHSGFALLLVLTGLFLPGVVAIFLGTPLLKKIGLLLLVMTGIFSLTLLSGALPTTAASSSWNIPSVQGVSGLQKIAVELLRLRTVEVDGSGHPPFVIAQTPGLAALLGTVLPISYPERSGAPPVFTPESPAFSSQFQLWPHYADAVAPAIIDPLYTEEKETSPFLGYDALYITIESLEELPETISGAFVSVTPLEEVTLKREGRLERLFIYQCKNYQMLSL